MLLMRRVSLCVCSLGLGMLLVLAPGFGCGSGTGSGGGATIATEEGKAQANKASADFYKSLPPGKGGARPRR